MSLIRCLKVYDSLTIVTIEGHKLIKEEEIGNPSWLCEEYELVPNSTGVLWISYNISSNRPYLFSILIMTEGIEILRKLVTENGYTIERIEEIIEPRQFNDDIMAIEILKHRNGWVILD